MILLLTEAAAEAEPLASALGGSLDDAYSQPHVLAHAPASDCWSCRFGAAECGGDRLFLNLGELALNSESAQLLTMEQAFALRSYAVQIQRISRADLEELLLEVMRQKMAQENVFKGLMRGNWDGLPESRAIDCGES